MIILIFLFSLVYLLISEQIVDLTIYFSLLFTAFSIFNYTSNKKISYIQIWNLAFLYIASSEMIIRSAILQSASGTGVTAVKIILFCNLCVNVGYFLNTSQLKKHQKVVTKSQPSSKIFNLFLFLSFVFFLTFIQEAYYSFTSGRLIAMENRDNEFQLLKSFIGGIGATLPVIATFYFRFLFNYKYKIKYVISMFLCIIPQIMYGTRYALLFSIVAPIILFLIGKKLKFLDYFKIAVFGFIFLFSINLLKTFRDITARDKIVNSVTPETSISEDIASYGSDEGVVFGTSKLLEYVNIHGYSYGKSSSFALFFWIPRSIWPDKPQQISYWLVRSYSSTDYSTVHSAAYGFWGELYMDFGYLTFLLLLLFGFFMKSLDTMKDHFLNKLNYQSTFYILLFPFFFLAVRSPQTSIISLAFIYIMYKFIDFIIRKYYLKKN